MPFDAQQIEYMVRLAQEAGQIILEIYEQDDHGVERKGDNSPVTKADIAAHYHLVAGLEALFPDVTIISEEDDDDPHARDLSRFFLVDPLDGTKSFIKRTGEFTVNIGYVEAGQARWGVIHVPVRGTTYFVGADGTAYKQENAHDTHMISTAGTPESGWRVLASLSHRDPETEAYLATLPQIAEIVPASSSLKFCLLAEGKADLYPRFGPTCEWDTCAGHAILEAAGGHVATPDGAAFTYGHVDQPRPFLNGAFIARGDG